MAEPLSKKTGLAIIIETTIIIFIGSLIVRYTSFIRKETTATYFCGVFITMASYINVERLKLKDLSQRIKEMERLKLKEISQTIKELEKKYTID